MWSRVGIAHLPSWWALPTLRLDVGDEPPRYGMDEGVTKGFSDDRHTR